MGKHRRPSTRSLTIRFVALSAAIATLIAVGLGLQMSAGSDPALGAKQSAGAVVTSMGGTAGSSASSPPGVSAGATVTGTPSTGSSSGQGGSAGSGTTAVTTRAS